MNKFDRQSWIAYSILLLLVFIRIIPFVYPGSRTWGFSHLIYLPDHYSIIFFALAVIALALPHIRQSESWGVVLVRWFNHSFYEGRFGFINRVIFTACMGILFISFLMPTHFLGDCYILIKQLAPATGMFFKWGEVGVFKWSEIGVAKFMIMVKSLTGGAGEKSALLAFRIVSLMSGLIAIWFFFLIAKVFTENKVKRLLVIASSLLSGTLLMFFGYAEHYPIIWAFYMASLYFFLKHINSNRGLAVGWIILLTGIGFHMQLAIFLPAALYATLSAGKGLVFYLRFKRAIWTTLGILTCLAISGLIYKYTTDLYIEDMFLPLFIGKPIDTACAAFSPRHLTDIINEFILVAPMFFIAFAVGIGNITSVLKHKITIFLTLAAVGSLLFLLFIDPKLGMPRDWDLFSLTPYAVTLLFIALINDSTAESLKKLLLSIIAVLTLGMTPYLMTNLDRQASAEYVEDLIKLDSKKTIAGLIILYDYYKELGDNEKARELGYLYHTNYPLEIKCNEAMDVMDAGDLDSAISILRTVEPNRFDASYQRALSRMYVLQGDYINALKHIDWTIELRRYFSQVYHERAMIYLNLNRHDEVFRDLRKAYQLNDSSVVILEALAYVHSYYKQYDSSLHYADKLKYVDSSIPISYYWIAGAYLQMNNYDSALYYANESALRIEKDTVLAAGLDNLMRQIKKISPNGDKE